MSEYSPGTFGWVDLATTDAAGAKEFYTGLFDWTYEDNPAGPDMVYSMCSVGGKEAAGLSEMGPDMKSQGIPPHWSSYVSVASADETASKAKELGGNLIMEPFDVMEAGRMAIIQDPTGAMISVWQPNQHKGAAVTNQPGSLTWNELATNDTATAETFYNALFGWTSQTQDMGGGFNYTSFSVGDRPNGGMMQIQAEWGDVPPHWGAYFAVADCDATCEKATTSGGTLLNGPQDIPEVGRFATLQDPQGAVFNVIQLSNPQ
jgi:hypothetical protein